MFLFAYFPYYPSDRTDIKVNRIHLFNFWQYKDQYITNPEIRERIQQLCELYVDSRQKVLLSMTIAVIDNAYDFPMLTQDQQNDIGKYAKAMLLCSIGKNSDDCGNFHSCCVSEHFTYFFQQFDLSSDAMTYTAGSYIRSRNMAAQLVQTKFIKPDYIMSVSMHIYDNRLFQAFANAIDAHDTSDEYLYKVLDWLRYAFMNTDGYSYESRLVMMATAFEVFFHLPKQNKTRLFAERLESLLGVDSYDIYDSNYNVIQTGLTRTTKTDGSGRVSCYQPGSIPINLTVYGWWAREFYNLRSKIVHEGIVSDSDFINHNNVEHLKISLRILLFCFFKLFAGKGYIILHNEPEYNRIAIHLEEGDYRKIETLL